MNCRHTLNPGARADNFLEQRAPRHFLAQPDGAASESLVERLALELFPEIRIFLSGLRPNVLELTPFNFKRRIASDGLPLLVRSTSVRSLYFSGLYDFSKKIINVSLCLRARRQASASKISIAASFASSQAAAKSGIAFLWT